MTTFSESLFDNYTELVSPSVYRNYLSHLSAGFRYQVKCSNPVGVRAPREYAGTEMRWDNEVECWNIICSSCGYLSWTYDDAVAVRRVEAHDLSHHPVFDLFRN